MKMNEETYGALKRIVADVKQYYAERNKDFPVVLGNDVQLVEQWLQDNDGEPDQIAIKWNVEDVLEVAPKLDTHGCRRVLALIKHNHDATVGVNWDVIREWASLYTSGVTEAC
jgi:hypothetical protein